MQSINSRSLTSQLCLLNTLISNQSQPQFWKVVTAAKKHQKNAKLDHTVVTSLVATAENLSTVLLELQGLQKSIFGSVASKKKASWEITEKHVTSL
jgi:hypothetical protein